jgi:hypothetical protein
MSMILGTYREMPGLTLHLNQAIRLFGLPSDVCRDLLEALVGAGHLRRMEDGRYVGSDGGFQSVRRSTML